MFLFRIFQGFLGLFLISSFHLFQPFLAYAPFPKDLLHVLHQGVGMVFIAALVCDHLNSKHPNLTLNMLDQLLAHKVYPHYRDWCRRRSPHVTTCSHRFNAARFNKEKWKQLPELNSVYKAAVVKDMMSWCADYLKEEMVGPQGTTRAYAMFGIAAFQKQLDSNGPFFDQATADKVINYARSGLLFYQELAGLDRGRVDGKRFYKITPKFHSLIEMLLYIGETKRNPRQLESILPNSFWFS